MTNASAEREGNKKLRDKESKPQRQNDTKAQYERQTNA